MSSDMALRFSGLLKVMTPTPSVTLCRILPSAKDLSVAFGTFSIGALSLIELCAAALKHCLAVWAMVLGSLSRACGGGRGGGVAASEVPARKAATWWREFPPPPAALRPIAESPLRRSY